MDLYIAEKPKLGKLIARHLSDMTGEAAKSQAGFIQGRTWTVSWCFGHLFELSPPEDYNDEWKEWSIATLPIVPGSFSHRLIPGKEKQFQTIKKLASKASTIFHCGDPDKEGQYLVDIVIEKLGGSRDVKRIWLNDLSDEGLPRLLSSPEINSDYLAIRHSAEERAIANWLVGLNFTRAYTVYAQEQGHQKVISQGSVQSPTLGLIHNRCKEIEQFKAEEHYGVKTLIETQDSAQFVARWVPGENLVDDNGRVLNKRSAASVLSKLQHAPMMVVDTTSEEKSESAPLPHSLPSLQVEAGKRLKIGVKKTLQITQYLYETLGLVTYPRTQCTYLFEGDFALSPSIIANISEFLSIAPDTLADISIMPRCYSDKRSKDAAHTAIVPTVRKPSSDIFDSINSTDLTAIKATKDEVRGVYELVAMRFLRNFMPAHRYRAKTVFLECEGESFKGTGRDVDTEGWKRFGLNQADEDISKDDAAEESSFIPDLTPGESVTAKETELTSNLTSPPQYYTEHSLIEAMNNIAKYVTDERLKQVLQENDGIGTPASQADIIEKLFLRDYVEKRKGKIHITDLGIETYAETRPQLQDATLAATWELALTRMQSGDYSPEQFRRNVISWLQQELQAIKASPPKFNIKVLPEQHCSCGGIFHQRKRKAGKGVYWVCAQCRMFRPDDHGKPVQPIQRDGEACPKCGEGKLVTFKKRKGKDPYYLRCNAKDCDHVEW
ncbi:hypothetical protein A3709_19670 [Halioglobus sp. HI00S01]|uniref:DNA topoisomerase n=1 Tax=Halioglobus sp. HI00S01 TaxID=1822214 RepID=UPI0007C2093A|nr:DNA topoisomerase [Halioglobus sp. HI00S01]KZX57845.1 hypothetical protein A3709_19670 [Halioglobus sp. HI00S01]